MGGGGVAVLLFSTHFSKISHENGIIWSHWTQINFIFRGYLKQGDWGQATP